MTIREALSKGNTLLAEAGIENASLDASLLLAEVLKISRSSLIAAGNDNLTEESTAAFNGLIQRRIAGECTAYILGRKEFYGLEFMVNPSVLVPRPDTETLVETAIKLMSHSPFRVLDLCTGSGAIAIALKHEMPELEMWATDISEEALAVAKANATRLLPEGSLINFCHGNLYDALPSSHCSLLTAHCSLIIANAPYIPTEHIDGLSAEVRMEPHIALDGGSDGLNLIRSIISRAPEFLEPGGSLLMEADPRQMESIATLLKQAHFIDIQTYQDLSGKERVIGGQRFS